MMEMPGVRLMHWHGGNDWVAMEEVPEHDVTSHDPERAWLKGARIFRCKQCEEQVAVVSDGSDLPVDHPRPGI